MFYKLLIYINEVRIHCTFIVLKVCINIGTDLDNLKL